MTETVKDMASKRQLAAIMCTDIAGFSRIMQTDPKLADEIRQRHLDVFNRMHDKFNGKLMQRFGDSTLSIFSSAAEAVECAYYLQTELRKSPEIPVKIGLHTGEIIYDEAGVYGEGINVASKVEHLAEPGSVLLTGKIYDDIKNHPWLLGTSLGQQSIDEQRHPIELYALTNRGLNAPSPRILRASRALKDRQPQAESSQEVREEQPEMGVKRKQTAAILAFLLGFSGIHRFYLGQRFRGFLYAFASFVALMMTIEEGFPAIAIMGMVTLVDAILFAVMPQVDFDRKYNKNVQSTPTKRKGIRSRIQARSQSKNPVFSKLKRALKKYEARKFEEAVNRFDDVLDEDPSNYAAHYYLACCFSELKKESDAFFHLDKAIDLGFDDFDRMERDKALRYIKSRDQFKQFRRNKYQLTPTLPPPSHDILDNDTLELSPLEKIEELGERLERGELSLNEFELEKRKILNR